MLGREARARAPCPQPTPGRTSGQVGGAAPLPVSLAATRASASSGRPTSASPWPSSLAERHDVVAFDIDERRVEPPPLGQEPHRGPGHRAAPRRPGPPAHRDERQGRAYAGADLVVVATPTSYDEQTNCFDTSSVEQVVGDVQAINPEATAVIKSTIPVGYTAAYASARNREHHFLAGVPPRGKALRDNLHPSRIIVGDRGPRGQRFAAPLAEAALDDGVPVLLTDSTEAEAIKLLREHVPRHARGLLQRARHVRRDARPQHPPDHRGGRAGPRIGCTNNPSFGYGGCSPKDTGRSCSPTTRTCRRRSSAPSSPRTRPGRTTSRPTSWRAGRTSSASTGSS